MFDSKGGTVGEALKSFIAENPLTKPTKRHHAYRRYLAAVIAAADEEPELGEGVEVPSNTLMNLVLVQLNPVLDARWLLIPKTAGLVLQTLGEWPALLSSTLPDGDAAMKFLAVRSEYIINAILDVTAPGMVWEPQGGAEAGISKLRTLLSIPKVAEVVCEMDRLCDDKKLRMAWYSLLVALRSSTVYHSLH